MQIEIASKKLFHSISEFRFLRELGVGSFGKVKLAVHKGTRKQYAIKVIDLTTGLKETQFLIIQREIKVHSQMDHPHIIKLWDTLRDDANIYMVMEYASNGSLFKYNSLQLANDCQPSLSQVYQFFYQTLQAISYLHCQDIMHRDIKPQNLLLDEELNIKICDFGWATSQIDTLRTTFCGTYQYMAPQMILEKSYDYKIDIWALGVLLYELIHGKAPFQGQSLKEMKDRIKRGSYQIDNSCSQYLRNLIVEILQFQPEKRLSLKQIQTHPWIKIIQNLPEEKQLQRKRHYYQKSMDNFLTTFKSQEDVDKTLKMRDQLHSSEKNGNHSKLLSQQKTNHLLNTLQTESNINFQPTASNIKKLKKKCKTQGEEEIIEFEKHSEGACKQFKNQRLDAAETKRKKTKETKENLSTKILEYRQKAKNKKQQKSHKLKNDRFADLNSKFLKEKMGLVRKNFP